MLDTLSVIRGISGRKVYEETNFLPLDSRQNSMEPGKQPQAESHDEVAGCPAGRVDWPPRAKFGCKSLEE